MKKLMIILSGIVVIAIMLLILIIQHFNIPFEAISGEVVKALLQIIAVIVVGQIVAFVIEEYRSNQKKKDHINVDREDFLGRVRSVYTSLRKIRSRLRHESIKQSHTSNEGITYEIKPIIFEEEIQNLHDVRFELLNIWEDSKLSQYQFSDPTRIDEVLSHMYEIMTKIVRDCEEFVCQKRFDIDNAQNDPLYETYHFIIDPEKSDFFILLEKDYRNIIEMVQGDILR